MYDLHAHILPGVDDGAKTIAESLDIARVAYKHGTRHILATPHRKDVTENWSIEHIDALIKSLNKEIKADGLNLTVYRGMENHLDLSLPEEIRNGRALPINDSKYILIELPFFGMPLYVEEVLHQIKAMDFIPVLVHPERIEMFQLNLDLLASFTDLGMLTQITAGSIVGTFGPEVKSLTLEILRRGLTDIIASDTHSPTGPRSPNLTAGLKRAEGFIGKEAASNMVTSNPKNIFDNQDFKVGS